MPDRKVGKIEARPTRVARSQWSRDPERVKGEAAEVETGPVPFLLVRQRRSAGLSRMWSAIEVGRLSVPKGKMGLPDCSTVAAVNASQSIYGFVFCLHRECEGSLKKQDSPVFEKSNPSQERKPPP
jgi:hypothetical protein